MAHCFPAEYIIVIALVVGLAGGLAGLWATCGRNVLAAKLFWWSWPASFALEIIQWIVGRFTIEQKLNALGDTSSGSLKPLKFFMFGRIFDTSNFTFVIYAVKYFFLAYFIKV